MNWDSLNFAREHMKEVQAKQIDDWDGGDATTDGDFRMLALDVVAGRTYSVYVRIGWVDGRPAHPAWVGIYSPSGALVQDSRHWDLRPGKAGELTFKARQTGTCYLATRGVASGELAAWETTPLVRQAARSQRGADPLDGRRDSRMRWLFRNPSEGPLAATRGTALAG